MSWGEGPGGPASRGGGPGEPVVWLNGALVAEGAARISPLDRGFLLGDGVFETLRAEGGAPFLLDAHLRRLAAGAAAVGIVAPEAEVLRGAVRDVLAANGLAAEGGPAARVRITVTRGAAPGGPWPEEPGEPTALVTALPLALPAGLHERGAAAILSAHRVASGAPGIKSTSYQPRLLALGEARRAGAWEAIQCNERGEVAEGATSNVFALLADGTLATPPRDAGILPGITRALVLRFAQPALCLDARERTLRPEDLAGAREAFLTNSVAGIVPLVRLDGRALGDGAPGPVTHAVRMTYREDVARWCEEYWKREPEAKRLH